MDVGKGGLFVIVQQRVDHLLEAILRLGEGSDHVVHHHLGVDRQDRGLPVEGRRVLHHLVDVVEELLPAVVLPLLHVLPGGLEVHGPLDHVVVVRHGLVVDREEEGLGLGQPAQLVEHGLEVGEGDDGFCAAALDRLVVTVPGRAGEREDQE